MTYLHPAPDGPALCQPVPTAEPRGGGHSFRTGAHTARLESTGHCQGTARGHQGRQSPASCPHSSALCLALSQWSQSRGRPRASTLPMSRAPFPLLPPQHTQAHTLVHTHTHTQLYLYARTHSSPHVHTCNYTYTFTSIHTRTHALTATWAHMLVHTCTLTHTHSHNAVPIQRSPELSTQAWRQRCAWRWVMLTMSQEVARACDARDRGGAQRCTEAELSRLLSFQGQPPWPRLSSPSVPHVPPPPHWAAAISDVHLG